MNATTRTLLVIAVAVATAAVASYGVYNAISRIPVREVEVANYQVVAAAQPLSTGTLIQRDSVKLVAWPERSPIPGAFTDVEDVVGRGLIASALPNEPITESKLAPREAGAGLPPSIPPGMRAMSVKVNEVIGVAGFVVPGTRVDVLAIIRGQGREDSPMTRAVVSNVQVLASGTRYDQESSRDGQPIRTTVVTLMMTPEDSERVALATSEGQIVLTLRNPLDVEPTQTAGIRLTALMAPPAPPPVQRTVGGRQVMAPARPAEPPARSVYTVEAIRAAQRTEEVVR